MKGAGSAPLLFSAISSFSLMRGVHTPLSICTIAKELGYSAVALTDLNNLYGLPAFIDACAENDIIPVAAAEICGPDGNALLYAQNESGFANLCRIISEKQCNKTFTLCESIKSASDGLHVVTTDTELINKLRSNTLCYFRMSSLRKPPSDIVSCKVPIVIIQSMAFRSEDDFSVHRLLRAIDLNTTLARLTENDLLDKQHRFISWSRISELFEVFECALESTVKLGCILTENPMFRKRKWIMPEYLSSDRGVQQLGDLAYDGAVKRYGTLSEQVKKRIEYELGIIESKGFSDYFLVVRDIVMQSPRTCGRGSGAASIIAYLLGITNVDPMRYNLMFERFLNPGRTDPPDIDIDFAWDERDDVLDYVFKKYGTAHTAMVATHQTCGARMAIREVARTYGMTESEISVITKKIPYFVDTPEKDENIEEVLHQWPSMVNVNFDPPWPSILRDSVKIMGMPRGIGTHCGGVVITPMPITSVAPVQYSAKGYPIIQWEKDGAERMGLVKIDLLGNRSLAVIRDAIANVKREHSAFDEKKWDPQSDVSTQDLLAQGKTMGVFYVESPAMRLLQRKASKGDFEHLTIHSSIIRPAANKYIREYVKRLHGAPFKSLHPLLTETLSETFGIMVYQEDVSKVAIALADFTVEDADMLRKIMSKKAKGRSFDEFKRKFYDGAMQNNVESKIIDEVWEMMLSFSGYSFCKPHSASYVQVSFQSAYLKTHYPAAFMAAVLSNYGGYYSTQAYISETQRLGITVMPPDVNISNDSYFAEDNSVVVGLCQIKGLSVNARKQIVLCRNVNGRFSSIENMLQQTGIDENDAEKLILSGACDTISKNINRAQLFWCMRRFYRTNSGGDIPELQPHTLNQYLQCQYQIIGFLTACHPMSLVKVNYNGKRIFAREVDKFIGKEIVILGWCVTMKTVSTRNGDAMEFVTFEDNTGIFETVFFPDVYNASATLLNRFSAFLLYGKVTAEFCVAVIEVKKITRP